MIIHLIRHAKTSDSENNLTQTSDSNICIDKDAKEKIKKIKKECENVEKVFCSPLQRTKETANLIFGKNNYDVMSVLREYQGPVQFMGKPAHLKQNYWKQNKYNKLNPDWRPEGGESFNDIVERTKEFWDFLKSIKDDYKEVAVVGHGIFFKHFLLSKYDFYNHNIFFNGTLNLLWPNLHKVKIELD